MDDAHKAINRKSRKRTDTLKIGNTQVINSQAQSFSNELEKTDKTTKVKIGSISKVSSTNQLNIIKSENQVLDNFGDISDNSSSKEIKLESRPKKCKKKKRNRSVREAQSRNDNMLNLDQPEIVDKSDDELPAPNGFLSPPDDVEEEPRQKSLGHTTSLINDSMHDHSTFLNKIHKEVVTKKVNDSPEKPSKRKQVIRKADIKLCDETDV